MALVVEATLPGGLAGGETANINLIARSHADTSSCDRNNVVRIVARAEAQVALALEADKTSVLPGDTIGLTLHFANTGERPATAIAISSFIDMNGTGEGTDYLPGSAVSTAGGRFEYYDTASSGWTAAAPPVDRIKGIRLLLDDLASGEGGTFSFRVRVRDRRVEGALHEAAASDYTGGDALAHHTESNDAAVSVRRVSSIAIGPRGNPSAAAGSPGDRVIVTLDGSREVYTLWHEILNAGNFADSVRVSLADSTSVPGSWKVDFVDSTGSPLPRETDFSAAVGTIPRGKSAVVGVRLQSTSEGFRKFAGRELSFAVEAASLFFPESNDRVDDVLIKTDVPVISIEQSIREPTALVGDVLSFIATVQNVTGETTLDSVVVVENLSRGLGYAGGTIAPRIAGNTVTWNVGSLACSAHGSRRLRRRASS